VRILYNMGSKEQSLGELSRRVNDRQYHVLRFRREGPNATLQIDNWDVIARHPHGTGNNKESSVFNRQSLVHVGGRWRPNKRQIERPYQVSYEGATADWGGG
jgi:neurexin